MDKEKKATLYLIIFIILVISGLFWLLKFNILSIIINSILLVLLFRAVQEFLGVHPAQKTTSKSSKKSTDTTGVSTSKNKMTAEQLFGSGVKPKGEKKIITEKIQCTHCQSLDVHFMGNDKKSFSVKKAAAGAVLTGGVGTLAGFAGKKGNKQWFCKNCNQIFETKK